MILSLRKIPFTFILFSALYAKFLYRQYIDIFFEAQFLHIDFLSDVQKGIFSGNNFFTTFGEHIFPGYNIILFLNYHLANIDSWFEFFINFISLFSSALIIYYFNIIYNNKSYCLRVVTCLILFSTTLNPSSGMALSASIGVLFFIIYSYFLTEKLYKNNGIFNYLILFSTIIISSNLFLGGYSIGLYSSAFLSLLIFLYKNKKLSNFLIINFSILLISFLIYLYLVFRYGNINLNSPNINEFSVLIFIKFILGMGGASLLGKAMYEKIGFLGLYFSYGILLYAIGLYFFAKLLKVTLKKIDYFLILIFLYSISNILFVSLFRYRNGVDGSLGQWYNIHTHFIVLFDIYYLFSYLQIAPGFCKRIICRFIIIVICVGALAGYYFDWQKAQYVPAWKSQFINQVPDLLLGDKYNMDSNDPRTSMLWDYAASVKGINFLYQNHLSIFKDGKPLTFGIPDSGRLIPGQKAALVCPFGTKNIKFDLVENGFYNDQNFKEIILEENSGTDLHFPSDVPGRFSFSPKVVNPIIYFNYKNRPKDLLQRDLRLKNFSCDGLQVQVNHHSGPIKIEGWGPSIVNLGQSLPTLQPDGSVGVWIRVSNSVDQLKGVTISLDGKILNAPVLANGLITVGIPADRLKKSGKYLLELTDVNGRIVKVGDIVVGD